MFQDKYYFWPKFQAESVYRLKKYIPSVILFAIGVFILDKAFLKALWNPNQFLFGRSLDALKNYFTPAWYIKYDEGFHFTGMNYPFGEHVLYTDNQPLISWLLNLVNHHILPVEDYSVGIFNTLMLLSFLGCLYVVFRILRHYYLPNWYAIPAAVVITFLSPQFHRFAGHFALAYPVIIPLIWWLLIRSTGTTRRWLNAALLILTLSLVAWIHAYYLLIGVLFSVAYFAVHGFHHRKNKPEWIKSLVIGAVAMVVPIMIFQIIMGITDPIADRPSSPYGFFIYRATWDSVFLPVQGPLWEGWYRFFKGPRPEVEGFAYVGLVATLVGLMTIVRTVRLGWKYRYDRMFWPALPRDLMVGFWAGFLLLLFAMAIPFRWHLEWLLDILTPLKQFRSLGRFAWVFFYTFSVYAAVYLYLIYRRTRQKGLPVVGRWILFSALIIWLWDAAIQVDKHAEVVLKTKGDNVFANQEPDFGKWLQDAGSEPEDFQALLPVPSFFTGSEKFVPKPPSHPTTARAYKLAYNLGLPMACGSMSRTSVSQSGQLIQILSGDLIEKTVLDHYPNRKPILILHEKGAPITPEETQLMTKAIRITPDDRFALYKLELDSLESLRWDEVINRFDKEKDSVLVQSDNLWMSGQKWTYFEGFDENGLSGFGQEYLTGTKTEPLFVFNDTIPSDDSMEFSIWIKVDPAVSGFPALFYREYNHAKEQIDYQQLPIMFGQTVYKDWLYTSYIFKPRASGNWIQFWLRDNTPVVESMLIRPTDTDIFLPLPDHGLMFNNFYREE